MKHDVVCRDVVGRDYGDWVPLIFYRHGTSSQVVATTYILKLS